MKNLHLIPTDKPSRVYKHLGRELKHTVRYFEQKGLLCINQNIYITSDEEIKEGDWIYNEEREPSVIQCIGKGSLRGCKKIILTTDQDLIKDGVQAIDDIFLEWFVENPSCESVEVDKNWNYPLDKSWEYKLRIIPQEEPKQETLEEAAKRTYTLDEVITLIKAFHLDTQEGKYSKELLDWCNKWIEDNIKNPI
jgi:hypothetical protein